MSDLRRIITKTYRRMGFKDGTAFLEYWTEENSRFPRPIPAHEVERRRGLIKRAIDADPEQVVLLDREPGAEG